MSDLQPRGVAVRGALVLDNDFAKAIELDKGALHDPAFDDRSTAVWRSWRPAGHLLLLIQGAYLLNWAKCP